MTPASPCSRSASAAARGRLRGPARRGARRARRGGGAGARAPSQRRDHPGRLWRLPRRRRRRRAALHARLRERLPLQIAGHYGLIDCVRDPFSAALRPTGSGAEIVEAIAGATPPGSICVSDDFAAVLAAVRRRAGRGELDRRAPGVRRRLGDRPLRAQPGSTPHRISSSSRCGATTTSASASRRMMPRRSSALTARDAVSRVVETRSARSARTGPAGSPGRRSAAPGAAARHAPARPRTARHARTCATPSAAAGRPSP